MLPGNGSKTIDRSGRLDHNPLIIALTIRKVRERLTGKYLPFIHNL